MSVEHDSIQAFVLPALVACPHVTYPSVHLLIIPASRACSLCSPTVCTTARWFTSSLRYSAASTHTAICSRSEEMWRRYTAVRVGAARCRDCRKLQHCRWREELQSTSTTSVRLMRLPLPRRRKKKQYMKDQVRLNSDQLFAASSSCLVIRVSLAKPLAFGHEDGHLPLCTRRCGRSLPNMSRPIARQVDVGPCVSLARGKYFEVCITPSSLGCAALSSCFLVFSSGRVCCSAF